MIYRSARIALEVVGIAIGGLLVLAAVAVWRLSSNSVESGLIRPYLEQEINGAGLGFAVHLTEAKIEWHRFRPLLDLDFRGVSVVGQNGATVGGLRDGKLAFSIRDWVFGRPSLIEIEIHRPEITIVRDATDHFSLSVGAPQGVAGQPPAGGFGALLKRFLEPPSDTGTLGHLVRVRLIDGKVTVDDRKIGITWSAPKVDFDLARNAAATTARMDVSVALPDHTARLLGEARYDRGRDRTALSLNIENFDVAAAAPLANVLQPLAAFAVPVSGQVHAVIDRSGHLVDGDASLHGNDGKLVLPAYYAEPLALKTFALNLHLADGARRLVFDKVTLNLGDAQLAATGTAMFGGPQVSIDAVADITGVPLSRFDAIWPRGFAVGGRDWVIGHIPEGVIKSGKVHWVATGRTDDPSALETKSVGGAFDYSGLEVHYFPALPPVKGIAGHGTFDAAHMDLTIDSGSLNDIAVTNGAIELTGFDRDDRAIDINLSLGGPLRTALGILDMKPLGYAHDLGIAPDTVSGTLNMRTHFAFPLVNSLLFRQIRLDAKGTLDNIAVANVVGSRDVTEGGLAIALDKSGMRLNGTAKLAGVPLTLDWKESFEQADAVRSRIAFRSVLDDKARTVLALEPPDPGLLRGPVTVAGNVTIDRAHNVTLDATADIKDAGLAFDTLGLAKKPGDPGSADLSVEFSGDTLTRISKIAVNSPDLTLSGAVNFAPDGAFRHARLEHVLTPRNDYALTVDTEAGRPADYAVSVSGARFDAAPLLTGKSSSGGPPGHTPRLDLTLALDHVLTGEKTSLDWVAGTASMAGSRLDLAQLKAVAGNGTMTLDYVPDGNQKVLHFAADDAGQALAALGLTRGVRGGKLSLDGTTRTDDPVWLTTAKLDITDFRLTDAPIIARLVNAISPTGFVDLLSGQGLAFDHLNAEMDYQGGKITFRNGRSAGALGISFEGDVDLDHDRVALKGTVVPVDTFNRILAAIPVLGDVLTGGERGGLIGWTYTIEGTTNDPRVSVNPLSMFAPGFLRNLFFLGPKEPKPTPEKSPEAPLVDPPKPAKP